MGDVLQDPMPTSETIDTPVLYKMVEYLHITCTNPK